MAQTIRENRFYFILFGVFVLVGGIYLSQSNKADAIFFFSEYRTPLLNEAFIFITLLGEAPIYLFLGIAALIVRLRYSLLVTLTGLTVLGVSKLLKMFFAIDRPITFFEQQNLVGKVILIEGIDLHSGATSFPSGHTMSAFALFTLLIFLLPSKKLYVVLLFSLALLVGISRIYLVLHFWSDVYAGGIIGAVLAMLIYVGQSRFEPSNSGRLDRPVFSFGKKAA